MGAGVVWAVMGTLIALVVGFLTGQIIPGITYRDLRSERDVYREAAQRCSQTVTIVQAQNAAMMTAMQSQRSEGTDQHVQ